MRPALLGAALGALWGAGFVVAYIVLQDRPDLERAAIEPELAPVLLLPIGLGAVLGGLAAGGTAGIAVTFVYTVPFSSAWRTRIAPIAAFALCLLLAHDFVPDESTESNDRSVLLGRALPFRLVPAVIAALSVWPSMVRTDAPDRKMN